MGGSALKTTSLILAPVTGGLSVLGYNAYSKHKDAEKQARTAADQEKDALNQQNADLALQQKKEQNDRSLTSGLNLARLNARNTAGATSNFSGTLLTSPLGINGSTAPAQKTLLGQ